MYDVSGSIVIYRNSPTEVREAMGSFLNTSLKVKLYLVDNSPTHEARDLCDDERIAYIFNGRNLGFGAGHNLALQAAIKDSGYHVVLNPDVYFGPGVLEGLLDFLRERPDVGLVMPKILNPDGTIQHLCKRLPSPADLVLRRFLPGPFKRLIQDRLRHYELRDQDYNRTLSVPVLSGCFMMMNCAAVAQVGGFDERYFMYLEDVDLCRRIGRRFETIYYPEVAAYHHYAKGSYRDIRLLTRHVLSALRYFQKWGWLADAERVRINEEGIGRDVSVNIYGPREDDASA
jgi:hypothetical protein